MHCRKCTGNSKTDDPDIFEDADYPDLEREQYKYLFSGNIVCPNTAGTEG
jgi:hypothetical protein